MKNSRTKRRRRNLVYLKMAIWPTITTGQGHKTLKIDERLLNANEAML